LRGDKERKEIIDDLIKEIRKKFKTKAKETSKKDVLNGLPVAVHLDELMYKESPSEHKTGIIMATGKVQEPEEPTPSKHEGTIQLRNVPRGVIFKPKEPIEACEHENAVDNMDGQWYCHACGVVFIPKEKEPTPSKSCETCDYENNDQDNHPCNDCGALRLHWKPKEPTEVAGSARQTEFELIEKFIPPRGTTCKDCMEMGKDELKMKKADLEWLFEMYDSIGFQCGFHNIPLSKKFKEKIKKLKEKYLKEDEEK